MIRSILTAPRDGTVVLIFFQDEFDAVPEAMAMRWYDPGMNEDQVGEWCMPDWEPYGFDGDKTIIGWAEIAEPPPSWAGFSVSDADAHETAIAPARSAAWKALFPDEKETTDA